MKKVDVLIIGGGFSGVAAAQELEENGIETLLVDKKDYFEVTFATLRDVAAPHVTQNKARKEYKDFLKGSFIQSGVSELENGVARLEDGTTVEFNIGIIASGSRYPTLSIAKSYTAFDLGTRNNELLECHEQIKAANKVLIIGGGVVGVELAGEIAYAFPEKKTILAHNTGSLLKGFKEKTSKTTLKQLEDLGVEVEFNTKYQNIDDDYIDQNTGNTSDADLVFQAVGTKPNSEFLKPYLSDALDERGFVKVNEQLEVIGQNKLYALGDVANVGEAKLGYLAQKQGEYLAKVIVKKLKNKNVKGYKRNPLIAFIITGRKTGIVEFPFLVTTFRPLINMKQKDVFINKVYSAFGALLKK